METFEIILDALSVVLNAAVIVLLIKYRNRSNDETK